MYKKLTGFCYKYKWPVVAFWVIIMAMMTLFAPDLSSKAKNDQAGFLPSDSAPVKANKLLQQLFPDRGGRTTIVLTLERKGGLSDADRKYALNLEQYLVKKKDELKITELISPFSKSEIAEEMFSENGEAAIISISLSTSAYTDASNKAVLSIRNDIQHDARLRSSDAPIPPDGLSIYATGDAVIGQEEHESVNESMERTTRVTIILVAVILILIYRSPIAPLIPLISIGISYSISRGLIAIFADMGLKVSSFTETFLIAVLFGAGTDYCLLIISRFREELASSGNVRDALLKAMPTTGEAVLSSGGTVIIGFCFMIFARFGLYNTTGPSVAIGVAITLLAVLTLVPAMLAILGEKVFWPVKAPNLQNSRKRQSTFWHEVAAKVTSRPVLCIVISLLFFSPFFIASRWLTTSYDQLSDLPSYTDSVKGFEVMEKYFGKGEILPVKLVIRTDKDLWAPESLQLLERLADNLSRVENVSRVRSATRPLGEKLTETNISSQLEKLSEGLGSIKQGFSPITKGLDDAAAGIGQISGGISNGASEIGKLADATGKAAGAASQTRDGINRLASGIQASEDALGKINSGLASISAGFSQSNQGMDSIISSLHNMEGMLTQFMQKNPEFAESQDFQAFYSAMKSIAANLESIAGAFKQYQGGISASVDGLGNTQGGLEEIRSGMLNASYALDQLRASLSMMADGQARAGNDLNLASKSLESISTGISTVKASLEKMASGISTVQETTKNYSASKDTFDSLFYLPSEAFTLYPQLKKAMENYISTNGMGATFDIILSTSPFSDKALNTIDEINQVVRETIRKTPFDNAEFYIGGATSVLSEVKNVTSKDFNTVTLFVLSGIFIVLVLLLRSLVAPIYLILSILLSYWSTLGITYLVFQVMLGHDGISWAVQFFAFCVLVALGVDYNIFLMTRVKEEYRPYDVRGSAARALSSTGGIITSCGIIMAGTFGAIMASPIRPLVQVGFAAVVGLLLDTFIIRCVMVPAIVVKVGELNWWPGKKVKIIPAGESKNPGQETDSCKN